MEQDQTPAIVRVVAHHGGPTVLARKLGGTMPYQEVQRWVKRGWASPMHYFNLEPLLPEGMTLRDLNNDHVRAAAAKAAAKTAAQATA